MLYDYLSSSFIPCQCLLFSNLHPTQAPFTHNGLNTWNTIWFVKRFEDNRLFPLIYHTYQKLDYFVAQIQAPSQCALVTRVNTLEAAWTTAATTRVTACTVALALIVGKVNIYSGVQS